MLRFRASTLFSSKSYLEEIRQIAYEITSECSHGCYQLLIDPRIYMRSSVRERESWKDISFRSPNRRFGMEFSPFCFRRKSIQVPGWENQVEGSLWKMHRIPINGSARFGYFRTNFLSSGNTDLRDLRVEAWKMQTCLGVNAGLAVLQMIITTHNYRTFRPDGWKSPVFYAVILETCSYAIAFLHVACYLIVVSVHVVLPLLRRTIQLFEESVKSMDIVKLEVSSTGNIVSCDRLWKTLTQRSNSAGSHP